MERREGEGDDCHNQLSASCKHLLVPHTCFPVLTGRCVKEGHWPNTYFFFVFKSRFYCASSTGKKAILDFDGKRRIWDGPFILRKIDGNRALYIVTDEVLLIKHFVVVVINGHSQI